VEEKQGKHDEEVESGSSTKRTNSVGKKGKE
jgi:hypothetical protein